MRILPQIAFAPIAFVLALAGAPVALAQEATPPAVAPVDPATAAAAAELQTAGEEIEALFETLEAEAAVVRADTTLSDEKKQARILALVEPHQEQIGGVITALAGFITAQAVAEGASPEEAAQVSAMMEAAFGQALIEGLLTGDYGDEEATGEVY
jgi:hypothetical protein